MKRPCFHFDLSIGCSRRVRTGATVHRMSDDFGSSFFCVVIGPWRMKIFRLTTFIFVAATMLADSTALRALVFSYDARATL